VRLPEDVSASVLVPNERGLERALVHRSRFDEVSGFLSSSETHNHENVGRSVIAGVMTSGQHDAASHTS